MITQTDETDETAELWGCCDVCDRWFYCGHGQAEALDEVCPVCATPPSAVERRPAR